MWGEVIELLIALPIAAALQLLVPRRVSHVWAIWLLICLVAGSFQWIAQGVYAYYNPDRLYLSIKESQVELQKDQAGEVATVVVNNPPAYSRLSRSPHPVRVAGSSLLLAGTALLLLLRAEPKAASPKTAGTSAGRGIGISLQSFGLAVLVASTATAVVHRSSEVNVFGVVVIASGYYVSRGSRLAAKWAVAFMALIAAFCLFFVSLVAVGVNVEEIGPSEAPWAITIGLAATVWAVVNLLLTARFLRQTTDAAELDASADGGRDTGS